MSRPYDLLIRNVRVVRPRGNEVHECDVAVQGGKFSKIASRIDPRTSKQVYDGKGRLAFPGVVDAHMHAGIYSPRRRAASPRC
jgi:allantoinase